MPENPERKSARIYPFPSRTRPVGGVSAVSAHARSEAVTPLLPMAPCGSGWYHDAAIRETAPERKN